MANVCAIGGEERARVTKAAATAAELNILLCVVYMFVFICLRCARARFADVVGVDVCAFAADDGVDAPRPFVCVHRARLVGCRCRRALRGTHRK